MKFVFRLSAAIECFVALYEGALGAFGISYVGKRQIALRRPAAASKRNR